MLVEQDSEVRVVSVHPKLIGDVRNMISGFLEDNCMKPTTGSGDNIGRISARRAWIPLKEGKAELMMHDVAVRCGNVAGSIGLGMSKVDHGKDHGVGFGEGSNLSARTGTIRVVGSRVGGTCTPLGTGRANWVCSHVCGTCRRLLSKAIRAASIGERLRMSRNLGGRDWLFKSRRRQRYHM